ncbi:MAG TPA: FG-GAP-like repeat-containing protein [Solirubrobacterales bacterium]|nr:FG-GAP-like repeat-containing protein [Solirubrobacterales bacterium]
MGIASSSGQAGTRRAIATLAVATALCGAALAAVLDAAAGSPVRDPGSFVEASGSPVPVGDFPSGIAKADFDDDDDVDLAVANRLSGDVTILLGDGEGGFAEAPGSPVDVGSEAASIAAARFDGDQDFDLAVVNHSQHVTILLGDGDGGFSERPGGVVEAGVFPSSVVAADINGDADSDLVVGNYENHLFPPPYSGNHLTILLGDGSGGFAEAPGSPVSAGTDPLWIAPAKLDGDGNVDLAVANLNSDDVTILLGDGTGSFVEASGSPIPVGNDPRWIAAEDLDGDSDSDLAVASEDLDDTGAAGVAILLGDGTGGFAEAPGSPLRAGHAPGPLTLADLDLDARTDLAVTNLKSDDVSVFLGRGSGRFREAEGSPVQVESEPRAIAAGRLDGDPLVDLAVGNSNSDELSVLLNDARLPRCAGREATMIASAGRAPIRGTRAPDVVAGSDGGERILTRGGADRVCAGGGNDEIRTAGGRDLIRAGDGADTLQGGPGRDRLVGGAGRDDCRGGKGKDVVRGC